MKTTFKKNKKIGCDIIVNEPSNSEELKLHTPNTVVAFSNNRPRVDQLAQERWRIFKIKGDDLVDVTNASIVKKNKCY